MDDLALLKDMADDTPLPSAGDLAPARARLQAVFAASAPPVAADATAISTLPAGRRRRYVLSGAAVVGLAAAIIGVVALGGLEPVGVSPARADAAEILHKAADVTRGLPATPPRPDQFVYTKTQRDDGSFREAWLSADGTHDGLIAQDGERIPLAGCRNGKAAVIKGTEALPGMFTPCTPWPAYRSDLPTDTAGMREYLNQDIGGKAKDFSSLIHFAFAETYVAPASLAALFEAIADLPDLTLDENATDDAGRPGIGISWTRIGETTTLVFDATTHAFLGVTGRGAVVDQAIVDTAGQQP